MRSFSHFIYKEDYICAIKESTLEQIYNTIKEDIRSHPEVKSSLLGMVTDWKRSQFVILADIISDNIAQSLAFSEARRLNLGTTISPITLQRFYENEYQIKTHNDLRFIKTLDKLCIFLNRTDLNDYIHQYLNQENNLESKEEHVHRFPEKELIMNFCRIQFEALKDLPAVNLEEISTAVCENSPLLERLALYLEEKSKKNLVFITENNRSNYEIFQIIKICDDPELKVIKTQEFWNLVFKDEMGNNFVIHHLNSQFYFIKKLGKEWKIWDNYNPDYGKVLKIN